MLEFSSESSLQGGVKVVTLKLFCIIYHFIRDRTTTINTRHFVISVLMSFFGTEVSDAGLHR